MDQPQRASDGYAAVAHEGDWLAADALLTRRRSARLQPDRRYPQKAVALRCATESPCLLSLVGSRSTGHDRQTYKPLFCLPLGSSVAGSWIFCFGVVCGVLDFGAKCFIVAQTVCRTVVSQDGSLYVHALAFSCFAACSSLFHWCQKSGLRFFKRTPSLSA